MTLKLRKPRVQMLIAGGKIRPLDCNVHVSIHQSADTFYARLPLIDGPDAQFWLDTAPIPITIEACNDDNTEGMTQLLVGQVDEPQVDFRNRSVMIKGRDLTAKLISQTSSEMFPNLTNQELIEKLASQAGLTVKVNVPDNNKAGLQYGSNTTEISDLDSAWNVIVASARRLGCIAFVKGTVLYIQPIDQEPDSFFSVRYTPSDDSSPPLANAMTLLAARNLELAKDVTVAVSSWQHKLGEIANSMYGSKGKNKGNDKLLYQHRAANLNKRQQDSIAKNHLREILNHERVINLSMPGDVTVTPLMGLRLSGTGTDADQDYTMADITHEFSHDGGYLMDISAHSQDDDRGEPQQIR